MQVYLIWDTSLFSSGRFDHRSDLSIEHLEQKRNNTNRFTAQSSPQPEISLMNNSGTEDEEKTVKERIAEPRPEVVLKPTTVQIGEIILTLEVQLVNLYLL